MPNTLREENSQVIDTIQTLVTDSSLNLAPIWRLLDSLNFYFYRLENIIAFIITQRDQKHFDLEVFKKELTDRVLQLFDEPYASSLLSRLIKNGEPITEISDDSYMELRSALFDVDKNLQQFLKQLSIEQLVNLQAQLNLLPMTSGLAGYRIASTLKPFGVLLVEVISQKLAQDHPARSPAECKKIAADRFNFSFVISDKYIMQRALEHQGLPVSAALQASLTGYFQTVSEQTQGSFNRLIEKASDDDSAALFAALSTINDNSFYAKVLKYWCEPNREMSKAKRDHLNFALRFSYEQKLITDEVARLCDERFDEKESLQKQRTLSSKLITFFAPLRVVLQAKYGSRLSEVDDEALTEAVEKHFNRFFDGLNAHDMRDAAIFVEALRQNKKELCYFAGAENTFCPLNLAFNTIEKLIQHLMRICKDFEFDGSTKPIWNPDDNDCLVKRLHRIIRRQQEMEAKVAADDNTPLLVDGLRSSLNKLNLCKKLEAEVDYEMRSCWHNVGDHKGVKKAFEGALRWFRDLIAPYSSRLSAWIDKFLMTHRQRKMEEQQQACAAEFKQAQEQMIAPAATQIPLRVR